MSPTESAPPAPDGQSDAALVRAAAGGEDKAFDRLMSRHAPRIVRFLTQQTGDAAAAEDIAQDSFVALYRNLDRFDPDKPFETWLFTIARNKMRDHFRRRTVLRWLGEETDFDRFEGGEADPETIAGDRGELRRLSDDLARLPEGLRTPLLLASVEGMPLAEIGTVMGLTEKAVEVRIYRARKVLRSRRPGEA